MTATLGRPRRDAPYNVLVKEQGEPHEVEALLATSDVLSCRSKIEPDAELQLAGGGGRGETKRSRRRYRAVAARRPGCQRPELIEWESANDIIDAQKVRPVKQVEPLKSYLEVCGSVTGKRRARRASKL